MTSGQSAVGHSLPELYLPGQINAGNQQLLTDNDIRRFDERGDFVAIGKCKIIHGLVGDARSDHCLAADVDLHGRVDRTGGTEMTVPRI